MCMTTWASKILVCYNLHLMYVCPPPSSPPPPSLVVTKHFKQAEKLWSLTLKYLKKALKGELVVNVEFPFLKVWQEGVRKWRDYDFPFLQMYQCPDTDEPKASAKDFDKVKCKTRRIDCVVIVLALGAKFTVESVAQLNEITNVIGNVWKKKDGHDSQPPIPIAFLLNKLDAYIGGADNVLAKLAAGDMPDESFLPDKQKDEVMKNYLTTISTCTPIIPLLPSLTSHLEQFPSLQI
jgi:hypothetical protein